MQFAEFKRGLYAGNKPGTLARILNRGWATLHGLGIAPNYLVTLEVRGRKSGETISFPLVMATHEGERYLVAMLGERVAWVRNVRAAQGRARLLHGRHEDIQLVEIPASARAAIIKAYLAIAPGARPHIPIHKDAPVEAFDAIAYGIPVFRVEPGDEAGTVG